MKDSFAAGSVEVSTFKAESTVCLMDNFLPQVSNFCCPTPGERFIPTMAL
jgi:hypothetical protein